MNRKRRHHSDSDEEETENRLEKRLKRLERKFRKQKKRERRCKKSRTNVCPLSGADKALAPAIHEDIVIRWKDILKEGLSKEEKAELCKKYPQAENCTFVEPPKLNPEVVIALQEPMINRDSRLVAKQEKVATCLAALGTIISSVLTEDTVDKLRLLESLSDISRLLLDVQRDESMTRKTLILTDLNASMKDTLNATLTDEWLFGNQLEDNLKTAKPRETIEITLSSIGESSWRQYEGAFKKWWKFCGENGINTLTASIPDVLRFLTDEFHKGASYESINSYRSAVGLILGPEVGQDAMVKRFCKGVANLRPPKPKYDSTWNPKVVLNFLAQWSPNEGISLEQLSLKLTTLLALITGHRIQTLSLIKINQIRKINNQFEIQIPALIKTSGPTRKQPLLVIPTYTKDTSICAASALESYINRTKNLRGKVEVLLISYKKPHKAVGIQTLNRWIKEVLKRSGVDTNIFSAYSTRHTSTSAAKRNGVSIDTIRKTAGWTRESKTFAKFYDLKVSEDKDLFAKTILGSK